MMNKIILKGISFFINLYMLISCTKHNEYNAYFYNSSVGKIESELAYINLKMNFMSVQKIKNKKD